MIELENAFKIYTMEDNEIRALDGISLKIEAGEYVAVVGPSGSGKSTCLHIIGCLDTLTSGTYSLDGENISCLGRNKLAEIRNRTMGFVFQQYNLITKLNIFENAELPLLYSGMRQKERHDRVWAALETVGLADRARSRPSQLSGGQQQRASIARALAGKPKVILADEPTGALDSRTGMEVMGYIRELNQNGTTVILITHDMAVARQADRTVSFRDGRIIADEWVAKEAGTL